MNEGDLDLIHQLRNGGQAYEYDYKLKVIPAAVGELAADHLEAQNKLIEEMREALEWAEDTLYREGYGTSMLVEVLSKSNPNTPERNDK